MDKNPFYLKYKNPLLVLVLLTIMGGVFSYTKIKSALFPQITFPKIKVIADAGQQPVDQMTVMVTRPLENVIKQVPDLEVIKSTTSRGSCEISAFMNWKSNIDISQQQIEGKINQIKNQLPADINITVEKMNPSILPVMGFTLTSSSISDIELKQMALYTIKPFLSQVKGVSDIRVIGGKDKEFWAVLKPDMMSSLGLSPDKVSQALNGTNFIKSNGYSSDYRYLYLTLTNTQLKNLDQLQNLVIQNDGNRIIYFRDIADINIHEAKQYIKVNANGKESILIAVVEQPDANVVDLSQAMLLKIDDLKKSLPKDVEIKPYYNRGH